ncbi:hypothetical protein GCM10008171_25330 [Methylopila jiangsuensis]|uniref:Uncharacterized protein n=1 Tax=Methylopila jiangsuensis TaxID=586230 RepID=A0A9W6JJL6_9HYPH|nr:hypothetical protein [Methylopila jiangsuensis]MDR6286384.1 hypothetical protein [Methylopila jiangsuensis]GLK77279.1 hypothetical protein GCM10008171_25330 [Methylopila jiangsuensis]
MDLLIEIWAGLRPHVVEAAVAVGAALLTLVAARALEALNAARDRDLALSLYRTLENGLKAIIARRALGGGAVEAKEAADIVAETVDFAKANNARAVRKLKQTDAALREKAMARLPEARAAILSAVQVAGRRGEGGASA